MGESLKNRTLKALAWQAIGNYGVQIISFIISIFLARLLEPEQFGLVGVSLVFINVLQVYADMGFASALIQKKDATSLTYSSIFYLNIAAGLILSCVLFCSAPLIGRFYSNDVVTQLVRIFSVTFLINSFNIVQRTILRKNLEFRSLTLRTLISNVVAGFIAVFFAYRGFGIYALVIQNIIATIVTTIILWRVTEWYPKIEFSWKEVRNLTGFSAYVFFNRSIDRLFIEADTLIIGKLFSPATLGFFSRANSLNSLIDKNSIRVISTVFFPVLSQVQDNEKKFNNIYLKVVEIVTCGSFFLTGIFFLCGEELIIGLFGVKWEPSIFIFKCLILKGFTYPISSFIVSAFLAMGKSRENFYYGNIRRLMRLVPFMVAYFFGFNAFLYSIVAINILIWLMNNYFVTRTLKIPILLQIKAILPYLLVTTILTALIYILFPHERSYILAGVKVTCFIALFLAFMYFNNSLILIELIFIKKKLIKKLLFTMGLKRG